MKVILLKDVAKIGRKSEVVNVPDGYARNQLIPKGMAEVASPANIKKVEKKNQVATAEQKNNELRFDKAISALNDMVLPVPAELNEKGHAFKAISENDIIEAASLKGVDIDSAMIKIESPIKEAGEHSVMLMGGDKKIKFNIEVIKK